jgi:tetratricopeptide (TPR) repeat protein
MTAVPQQSWSDAERRRGLAPSAVQYLDRGNQWLDRGDFAAAERSFVAALRETPDHPELLRSLALGLQSLQRHAEALAVLRQAARLRADDALIQNALGSLLGEMGDTDAAIEALRRACELEPTFAAPWSNLGKALTSLGRITESELPLQRALALAPQLESARFQLAESLMMLGRIDESAAQYRELLRRHPGSGLAWWGLANLKSTRLDAADVEQLTALVRRRDIPPDEQIGARFALGKALDDVGRYPDAYAAYVDANTSAQQRFRWSARGFDEWTRGMLTRFEKLATPPADSDRGREVIFIVGMPRSASTLTEQILAAHPEVEGASELGDLGGVIAEESQRRGRAFPDWIGDADATDWQRLGQRYLERTARWRTQRPRFTDKMPNNWMLAGALRHMLPGARIVDCRRDPVETCWSCYRQIFWVGHEYSYSLDDLAAYWHTYDAAMKRWRALYPMQIREHVYEELLADPERQTRALLDFCGLPFDAACLRFHEAARSVRTASAAQVRQPLNRATARASHYGDALDPLRRALSR